uniref:Uncharacterized protein n=1 Tax=Rhodnius prolixus TaxID=13249 RepID=T1I4J8_RHOPR
MESKTNCASLKISVNLERDNLKLITGEYTNGNIYCSVKLPAEEIKIENVVMDVNKNRYYILLAAGREVKLQEGSSKTIGAGFHDVGYLASRNHLMMHIHPDKPFDPFYDGCNTEMTCFGFPDNCVQGRNCKLVVSVLTQGTNYRFRLKGESTGYIAVGLSHDDKM